jgi:PAS domain S-box-containing protein
MAATSPISDPFQTAAVSRWRWGTVAIALLLTVGAVAADWFTGPEVAFSIVYLLPVGFVTWMEGRWPGLFMAGCCGGLWLAVDLLTNESYSEPWIPYWNGLVRATLFSIVSLLAAEVMDRKRAEAALKHQRQILQSILDSMREGVIVANHDGELLVSNPAADSLLDIEQAEPRPRNTAALLRASRLGGDSAAILTRALAGELVPEAEVRVAAPSGREHWLRVHGRPWLDPDGRNHGSMVVLSDITARRMLERQIAEVSDREQRRLGEDLHDGLCQQLVSLTFAARMLADALQARDLPSARDAVRIAELLEDALAQAKDVARGLHLVPLESGGLAAALEELAARVRTQARIECTFTDRTHTPLTALTAMNDLFRIAQEAVTNAVKHAAARHIHLTLETTATSLILTIADDGCGLPLGSGQDRGLGLSMMRYRARMIGGDLKITSAAGQGTRITCEMPHGITPQPSTSPSHAVPA